VQKPVPTDASLCIDAGRIDLTMPRVKPKTMEARSESQETRSSKSPTLALAALLTVFATRFLDTAPVTV
jgi:hypothetical protein